MAASDGIEPSRTYLNNVGRCQAAPFNVSLQLRIQGTAFKHKFAVLERMLTRDIQFLFGMLFFDPCVRSEDRVLNQLTLLYEAKTKYVRSQREAPKYIEWPLRNIRQLYQAGIGGCHESEPVTSQLIKIKIVGKKKEQPLSLRGG
ncbi:hypothetical protein SARC_03665 [Sphaeroforma arctica JP610]|uniref:Uncharacterized protein n=1 Tax=Sphaeroforma arctica JP610 TaxID=667725 RepID=A0A0L0G505_9EUKA|nr:hypothetical protein SARC_03665 [Sphaeroforma arctica JP610]KNC84100.1 hypothetical protein SARC_03665 [Sphaeroforma arctica JP610]|eukprot:XP_014158002.1 hypothetical protein SARC_03665 [Sphaeroforma arctica JP610]